MPPDMPMIQTTVRFAPDAMEMVNKAAQEMGISVSQFVREAAIMRAMLLSLSVNENLGELSERVRHLSRRDD